MSRLILNKVMGVFRSISRWANFLQLTVLSRIKIPFSDSLIQASGQKLSFQDIDDYGIASKQILIDVQ